MKIVQSKKINHLEKTIQYITSLSYNLLQFIIKITINSQTTLLKIKFNTLIKIYR